MSVLHFGNTKPRIRATDIPRNDFTSSWHCRYVRLLKKDERGKSGNYFIIPEDKRRF